MSAKWVERPGEIQIGNHLFRIDWLSPEEWESARHPDSAAAVTEAEGQMIGIRLKASAAESFYQELLFHEITHAVWDSTMLTHAPLDSIEDKEEFVISLQSPVMLGVLRTNPHLVKYMMSDGTVVR